MTKKSKLRRRRLAQSNLPYPPVKPMDGRALQFLELGRLCVVEMKVFRDKPADLIELRSKFPRLKEAEDALDSSAQTLAVTASVRCPANMSQIVAWKINLQSLA